MQTNFANIPDNFDLKANYWELNPQHKYIAPYATLYKKYGKSKSSKLMWVIVLLKHPDDKKNKFIALTEEEKIKSIEKYIYPNLDWDDIVFQDCLKKFPEMCLTEIQSLVRQKLDYLKFKEMLIQKAQKEIETTESLERALDLTEKLDKLVSRDKKLFEEFRTIEELFFTERDSEDNTVYGGRQETLTEKRIF